MIHLNVLTTLTSYTTLPLTTHLTQHTCSFSLSLSLLKLPLPPLPSTLPHFLSAILTFYTPFLSLHSSTPILPPILGVFPLSLSLSCCIQPPFIVIQSLHPPQQLILLILHYSERPQFTLISRTHSLYIPASLPAAVHPCLSVQCRSAPPCLVPPLSFPTPNTYCHHHEHDTLGNDRHQRVKQKSRQFRGENENLTSK